MNENTPDSSDSSSNNLKSNQRRNIIMGIVGVMILTPLLIYTNCGNVHDAANSELNSENLGEGIHQKIFIDIAGEHVDDLKSTDVDAKITTTDQKQEIEVLNRPRFTRE